MNQTKFYFPLIFISLEDEPWEPIEPNPNAAAEDEAVTQESSFFPSDWVLASSETYTHEYLTQNGKVVRETVSQIVGGTVLSTKTLDFFYDESGSPFALNYSVDGCTAETYYYILNLQGDVVQIIDANGVMQAEYIYSPWGEIISAEGELAEINPLRYRGYYYDSETGFYYLRSRYYDPENHRFINADCYASTGQGFAGTNMFAYCNNCPINCLDTAGKTVELVVAEKSDTVPVGICTTLTSKVECIVKIPVLDDVTVVIGKGTAIESISFVSTLPKLKIGETSLSATDAGDTYSADVSVNGFSLSVEENSLSTTQSIVPPNDCFDIRVTFQLKFYPKLGMGAAGVAAVGSAGIYAGVGLGMDQGNSPPLYATGGGALSSLYKAASRVFMSR